MADAAPPAKRPRPEHAPPPANARNPKHQVTRPANGLKYQTPFVSGVNFKNDLPEVPCDPRMLILPLEPSKLSAFKLTSFETAMRPDLLASLEAGRISILDSQRFVVQQDGDGEGGEAGRPEAQSLPALHPDDRLLCDGRKNRHRSKNDVHWLMRSRYMAVTERTAQAAAASQDKKVQPKLTRESAIEQIEQQFADVARVTAGLQHPTKPGVTAVSVLPVLPDMELCPAQYHLVLCRDDLVTQRDALSMTQRQREHLLEQSLMKAYNMPEAAHGDVNAIDKFMALLLPSERRGGARALKVTPEDEIPAPRSAEYIEREAEGEYQWVREFAYNTKSQEHSAVTYAFILGEDHAKYVPINSSHQLSKRKRAEFQHVPIPEMVTLHVREHNTDESELIKQRMDALYGIDETYEELE